MLERDTFPVQPWPQPSTISAVRAVHLLAAYSVQQSDGEMYETLPLLILLLHYLHPICCTLLCFTHGVGRPALLSPLLVTRQRHQLSDMQEVDIAQMPFGQLCCVQVAAFK